MKVRDVIAFRLFFFFLFLGYKIFFTLTSLRLLFHVKKVGKFYELYHWDADVGVREAGLTYMRVSGAGDLRLKGRCFEFGSSFSPLKNHLFPFWKIIFSPLKNHLFPFWKIIFFPLKNHLFPFERSSFPLWKIIFFPLKNRLFVSCDRGKWHIVDFPSGASRITPTSSWQRATKWSAWSRCSHRCSWNKATMVNEKNFQIFLCENDVFFTHFCVHNIIVSLPVDKKTIPREIVRIHTPGKRAYFFRPVSWIH